MSFTLQFKWYLTTVFTFVLCFGFSQEKTDENTSEHHEKHESRLVGSHAVFAGISHAYIQENKIKSGDGLAVAAWALAYNYRISEKWGAGLQTEILLESFIIQDNNGAEIERKYPINIAPVAIYQPFGHFSIFGGLGFEIAPDETINFTRLGAEYAIPIKNNWELAITSIWDWKIDVYNSWGIGIIIGKIWGGKPKPTQD